MLIQRRRWLGWAVAALTAPKIVAAPPRWRGAQGAHRRPTEFVAAFRRFPRDPRLLFLHSPTTESSRVELEKLQLEGGTFQKLKERGWKIGESVFEHVQLIDADVWPGTAEMYGAADFPWVGCLDGRQVVRTRRVGCTPPLIGDTFYRLLTGRTPLAEPDPSREQRYPVRTGHWYIDGDFDPILENVLAHLRSPMHREQVPGDWKIERWPYEELRSLHDDLHERGQARELVSVS